VHRLILLGEEEKMVDVMIEYSIDRFVNREEEVKDVYKKIDDLSANRSVDKRVIIFTGERGTGKSWLLLHLQESVNKKCKTALIDLDKYVDWEPTLAVVELLNQLYDLVKLSSGNLGKTLPEMSRNLMTDLWKLLKDKPLVLFVDHVYESDWGLLSTLEDYLLGPLSLEPRVLLVMAGRGRPYPFKTPELRLQADFCDLSPFSKEATTEQLEHQSVKNLSEDRITIIHEISGGNPLANFLLATLPDASAALDRVIEGMLETVPTDSRRQVRDYLEALCVLQSFDEERIPTMLAAYYDDNRYKDWSYAQARQVRALLVKWGFAHWDEEKGAYALDPLTRKLFEHYLENVRTSADRDIWQKLQLAALGLYKKWVKDYPRTRKYWKREQAYHSAQLDHVSSERSW
jgi:hypothetical protein